MLTVFFLTVSLVSISDYRSTDFVVSSTVISVYRDVSTDCCSGRDNNILLMCDVTMDCSFRYRIIADSYWRHSRLNSGIGHEVTVSTDT